MVQRLAKEGADVAFTSFHQGETIIDGGITASANFSDGHILAERRTRVIFQGTKMKVWQCDAVRPKPGLVQADIMQPVPGPGELLVQIHAAGITPTELLWYPTTHTPAGEPRQNAVPGHEFSGVVAQVGEDVDISVGLEVYGVNDWFADGAFAEYCCTLPTSIAAKPETLTHQQAASVPISAMTAWQGLFDRCKLLAGERVLIHGGSGAVGIFAIQLAKWRNAQITTTASNQHREFLLGLGAQTVIDYQTERFQDLGQEFDVIFDVVGGETLNASWNVLRPNGRLVSIAASSEVEMDERNKKAFFIVEPNQSQLLRITSLIDSGTLKPMVQAEIPFEQAATAISSKPKHGCGKSVLCVPRRA